MKAVEAYPDIVPVEGHDAGGGKGHGNDSLWNSTFPMMHGVLVQNNQPIKTSNPEGNNVFISKHNVQSNK